MSKANEEIDYVERACALAPEIEARADQIEQERRLPEPVLAALFEAGLFRLLLPRSLDGGEVDPVTFARVMEEIAKADASTAWCLCQAAGCSMSAAYLSPRPKGCARVGPGARRAGHRRRRRLPGHGHLELRERRATRDVAGRALPHLRA